VAGDLPYNMASHLVTSTHNEKYDTHPIVITYENMTHTHHPCVQTPDSQVELVAMWLWHESWIIFGVK